MPLLNPIDRVTQPASNHRHQNRNQRRLGAVILGSGGLRWLVDDTLDRIHSRGRSHQQHPNDHAWEENHKAAGNPNACEQ